MDLLKVETVKLEWNWKPYFPVGKLVDIAGDGGVGKTLILQDIIARMSLGEDMPDGSNVGGGGAVFVTYEDGVEDTLVPRLIKMGADITRVRIIKDIPIQERDGTVSIRPFMLAEDMGLLEYAVRSVEARIVVIDPIMSALGSDVNPYSDADVRRALAPLVAFAEDMGVTVINIRHHTKQKTDNPLYRGGGSVAFANIARVALNIMPADESKKTMLLLHTKKNLTKEAKPLRYRVTNDKDEGTGEDEDTAYVVWEGHDERPMQKIVSASRGVTNTGQTRRDILTVLEHSEGYGAYTGQIVTEMQKINPSYTYPNVNQTLGRMAQERVDIAKTTRGEYYLTKAPVAA